MDSASDHGATSLTSSWCVRIGVKGVVGMLAVVSGITIVVSTETAAWCNTLASTAISAGSAGSRTTSSTKHDVQETPRHLWCD